MGDGCVLYNGYIYQSSRSGSKVYRTSESDLGSTTSIAITNGSGDAICAAGGFIWEGTSNGKVEKIDPATFTVVSNITVFSGATTSGIYSICADSNNVYVGGIMAVSGWEGYQALGKIVLATGTVTTSTITTYPYTTGGYSTLPMIHELISDGTYLYGDVQQGAGVFKASCSTLALVASAAEPTQTVHSEEIQQDSNYIYNITEIPTLSAGGVGVNRWAKSNLAYSFCTITNYVGSTGSNNNGLDSLVVLPDGSLLVGTNAEWTGGLTQLFLISSSFTYSGYTVMVSGLTDTVGQTNKIILDGDYMILEAVNDNTDNTTAFAKFNMPSVTTSTIAISPATSVAKITATVSGTLTNYVGSPSVTIYWGTTDGGTGTWANSVVVTSSAGAFSTDLTGLDAATPYYFSASIATPGGAAWPSASLDFTTLSTIIARFSLLKTLLMIAPALILLYFIFMPLKMTISNVKNEGITTRSIQILACYAIGIILFIALFPQIVHLMYAILTM